jgi:NAD(P)-dependent dehydrogenase (short-subunit alcohol dehydrogenase family)
MDLKIVDKRAVVSGSTAGIGFAIAKGLAQEGARVVINGRKQERVDKAIQEIKKQFPKTQLEGVAADLGSVGGIDLLIRKVPDVDILVNNLGIFEPKPFQEISDADWMRTFEVNVLSGVRLSRQYIPGMVKRNWGRVLFISSESGLQIPPEMIQYGVTKTAQLALARGLAESLAGTAVTVNALLPGPTASEGVSVFVDQLVKAQKKPKEEFEREFLQTMRPSSILKRFATPDEVAAMVVYLCSAQASATTGASVRVDGGVVRSIG